MVLDGDESMTTRIDEPTTSKIPTAVAASAAAPDGDVKEKQEQHEESSSSQAAAAAAAAAPPPSPSSALKATPKYTRTNNNIIQTNKNKTNDIKSSDDHDDHDHDDHDALDEDGRIIIGIDNNNATNPISINNKRVSFSKEDTDTAADFFPTRPGTKATRSAKVGKASPMRDLCIFIGILCFFYYISMGLQDVGKHYRDDDGGVMVEERKSASGGGGGGGSLGRFKQMRKALGQLLEAKLNDQYHPPRLDCDLFLAKSSIPSTGLGIFAGRNYSVGEEIMILGAPSILIEMNALSSSLPSKLWVTPQSLLLKHHPTLANIEPSQPLWSLDNSDDTARTTVILKTNQAIAAGEELLLHFDQHLHSVLPEWFNSVIPTADDYSEADFLIQEARRTFREPKGQRGRNANKQQQTGMVGQGLRMVQRVVSRYRPAVAKLLPIAIETLSTTYRGRADEATSLYLGLQNQSAPLLMRHGLCFSDISATSSETITGGASTTTSTLVDKSGEGKASVSSSSGSAVVTRNVTKGHRVHPLPLFLRLKSEGGLSLECPTETALGEEASCQNQRNSPCWSRPEALVEFCPMLALPSTMRIVERGSEEATVEIQWSEWAYAMNTTELDLSVIQDKNRSLESIFIFDMVAIRDLSAGDELALGMERDQSTGQWILPADMLPRKWLDR